ncbi:eukaryotic translation initiation factor 2 subunit beta-like [Amaranthus tricolor]|uniref:eukaryotic translation initiation factor 2 subunit beta-like n=1 Tax=Amaranthus tricolor TaxID=29722 RepID=UPI0025845FCA|nr:eukaryotic translation initiation factor 2 subunit beta-like [Amaranthus tricolor]XP_057532522.1 eukaryotic translation initiation factor 2 subunit beta-like [Amaranthus tricolor]XP_057532523.1 eukaryotic translation initiation factor 2 subunit beta-like [Amaranthus tricolor]
MASEDNSYNIPELAPFDPTKKKKKKKVTTQEFTDENAAPSADKTENMIVFNEVEIAALKKKKIPVDSNLFDADGGEEEEADVGDNEQEDETNDLQQLQYPWEGNTRDYEYEEILGRVFNILRENNPELAGNRRRTVMRPPQVMREGTKKTVFANFTDLCKMMHRQPEHVMSYLLAELGTNGSLDGQQRLVVKGRFAPKNFEGILRKYANEYVVCSGCKSSDTILAKENRLLFLRCEQCGSSQSVSHVSNGFVARVGRRAAA